MPLAGIPMVILGYDMVRRGLVKAQLIKELVFISGIVILFMWMLLMYAYLFRKPVPKHETKR